MKTCVVTLAPLEPYFFGSDKTFSFNKSDRTRNNYYIRSLESPSPTTILGMVRHELLKQAGHYSPSFQYTESQLADNARLIGKESFSLAQSDMQSFGVIQSISAVHLMHDGSIYWPIPGDHNKSDDSYAPIKLTNDNSVTFSSAACLVPDDVNAVDHKKYSGKALLCVDNNSTSLVPAPFRRSVKIGIGKNTYANGRASVDIERKEMFFKKEYCTLEEGWKFIFMLTLNDDAIELQDSIVTMGQGKSAFAFCVNEISPQVYEEQTTALATTLTDIVRSNLPDGYEWYYVHSDTLADQRVFSEAVYTAAYTMPINQLVTDYRVSDYRHRLSKNHRGRRNVVCAGGCFYTTSSNCSFAQYLSNANAQHIGFNAYITTRED